MAITKIMVVDRDRDTMDEIRGFTSNMGLTQIIFEPVKNKAIEMVKEEHFDGLFFDPSPNIEQLRAFVIGLRRDNDNYLPITIMSRQLHRDEAVAYGANDFIAKPVEFDDIQDTVKNMKNLSDLIIRLRDDHKDFISRDGVVSKTAFYQVFSSCLDRADRYGEETFLIFVRIDNIRDLQNFYGEERTEDICTKVKKYTVKIRRLSDIIGRTAVNELCLVVSRPMNKNEPIMAVNRFSDTLMEYADMFVDGDARAKVSVHMMAIPSGKILFSKQCYSD